MTAVAAVLTAIPDIQLLTIPEQFIIDLASRMSAAANVSYAELSLPPIAIDVGFETLLFAHLAQYINWIEAVYFQERKRVLIDFEIRAKSLEIR